MRLFGRKRDGEQVSSSSSTGIRKSRLSEMGFPTSLRRRNDSRLSTGNNNNSNNNANVIVANNNNATTANNNNNNNNDSNSKSRSTMQVVFRRLSKTLKFNSRHDATSSAAQQQQQQINMQDIRGSASATANAPSIFSSSSTTAINEQNTFTIINKFDAATTKNNNNSNNNNATNASANTTTMSISTENDMDGSVQILSRSSSAVSSAKSTPVQFVTNRNEELFRNKSISNSVMATVKALVQNGNTIETNENDSSTQFQQRINQPVPSSPISADAECRKIIDTIAELLEKSYENAKQENLSMKSLEFCGKRATTIGIRGYMLRIVGLINKIYDGSSSVRDGTGIRFLLLATIYIERILSANEDLILAECTVHRLFLAGFMLALKMHEDEIPSEDTLADIAGVKKYQLHNLESKFYEYINYRLWVSTEDYKALFNKILTLSNLDFTPDFPDWLGC